jgi:hypothetical protein
MVIFSLFIYMTDKLPANQVNSMIYPDYERYYFIYRDIFDADPDDPDDLILLNNLAKKNLNELTLEDLQNKERIHNYSTYETGEAPEDGIAGMGFAGRGYSKLSGKVGKCGMRKGACNCK